MKKNPLYLDLAVDEGKMIFQCQKLPRLMDFECEGCRCGFVISRNRLCGRHWQELLTSDQSVRMSAFSTAVYPPVLQDNWAHKGGERSSIIRGIFKSFPPWQEMKWISDIYIVQHEKNSCTFFTYRRHFYHHDEIICSNLESLLLFMQKIMARNVLGAFSGFCCVNCTWLL